MNSNHFSPVDVKKELAQFADGLSIEDFKSLSSGLGLGRLQKIELSLKTGQKTSTPVSLPKRQAVLKGSSFTNSAKKPFVDESKKRLPQNAKKSNKVKQNASAVQFSKNVDHLNHHSLWRYGLSHVLDLFISTMAVGITLLFVSFLMTMDQKGQGTLAQTQLFLSEINAFYWIGVIYLAYVIYFFIFKVFAGITMGDQVFLKFSSKKK